MSTTSKTHWTALAANTLTAIAAAITIAGPARDTINQSMGIMSDINWTDTVFNMCVVAFMVVVVWNQRHERKKRTAMEEKMTGFDSTQRFQAKRTMVHNALLRDPLRGMNEQERYNRLYFIVESMVRDYSITHQEAEELIEQTVAINFEEMRVKYDR